MHLLENRMSCCRADIHAQGRQKPGAIAPTANQYRAILYDYIRAELFAYAMFFTILVDFHHYVSVYIHPCIIILRVPPAKYLSLFGRD